MSGLSRRGQPRKWADCKSSVDLIQWDAMFVQVPPESREAFADAVAQMAQHAIRIQGLRAFDMPLSAAAVHEPGHAVLAASAGKHVTLVKIIRGRLSHGRRGWGGVMLDGEPWRADRSTDPREDLRHARRLIAGVRAESIFDGPNFRYGSSLDEIVAFHCLVTQAARKLGADRDALASEQLDLVDAVLHRHTDVVQTMADWLRRHGSIKGERLSRMLAPVMGGRA